MSTYLNRFEKKFFISVEQELRLKEKIKKIFLLDKFISKNKGYFCISIYFDS